MGLSSKAYKKNDKKENPCVYKIDCGNCSKCYVGKTRRTLKIRTKEHANLRENSALTLHSKNLGHSFRFGDSSILISESNVRRRKILELLFLKRYDHVEDNRALDLLLF